jgi:hypothetical protein
MVPSGRAANQYRQREIVVSTLEAASSPLSSILEAMLPDAIFRVAVLDLQWSVTEAALLYRAACVIVG